MDTHEGTNPLQDWIGWCLESKHTGYRIDRVVEGSYGRVWIMRNPNASPAGIAIKSFRLRPGGSATGLNPEALFEREIKLWVGIPLYTNVLPALGIDCVPSETGEPPKIPTVRMTLMDGSLRDWIGRWDGPDEANRLVAVAQLCNGLGWLYCHGVLGHGDLKPENVLFRLSHEDRLIGSRRLPWTAVVADLGWAKIWDDLVGDSNRGWHPYMAPERVEAGFDARRSDSYAVGVILAELLTGLHPAGKPTEGFKKWQLKDWLNWAKTGARKLTSVNDNLLRTLVERCLSPAPVDRPDPVEIAAEIAAYAEDKYGIQLAGWLEAQNLDAAQNEPLHPGWANEQIATVREQLRQGAIHDLRNRMKRHAAQSRPDGLAASVWLARSLIKLLSQGDNPLQLAWLEGHDVAVQTCRSILDSFQTVDLRKAMLYVPEDTSRQEVLLSVLNELLHYLYRTGGSDLPEVVDIRQRIARLIETD